MIIIGLTGSIGMGKSATANMFRDEGIPVHDSDAAVHSLYSGLAVPVIAQHFPDAIVEGIVHRPTLGSLVLGNDEKMKLLESLIHPLVEARRAQFISGCKQQLANLAVVDIPLLFEVGGIRHCDVIAVCSASADVQEKRVLARQGMTREKFAHIQSRQIPDREKRERAHVVIETGLGFDYARRQVRAIIRALSSSTG